MCGEHTWFRPKEITKLLRTNNCYMPRPYFYEKQISITVILSLLDFFFFSIVKQITCLFSSQAAKGPYWDLMPIVQKSWIFLAGYTISWAFGALSWGGVLCVEICEIHFGEQKSGFFRHCFCSPIILFPYSYVALIDYSFQLYLQKGA